MLPVNNGICAEYSFFDWAYSRNQPINSAASPGPISMELDYTILTMDSEQSGCWRFDAPNNTKAKITYGDVPDVLSSNDKFTLYTVIAAKSDGSGNTGPLLTNHLPTDNGICMSVKSGYAYISYGTTEGFFCNGSLSNRISLLSYISWQNYTFHVLAITGNMLSGEVCGYVDGEQYWQNNGLPGIGSSWIIGDYNSDGRSIVSCVRYIAYSTDQHSPADIEQNSRYLYNKYVCPFGFVNNEVLAQWAPAKPEYSMKPPYPISIWRIDPWWNDGVPYTMLPPEIGHVEPPDHGYDTIELLDKVRVISRPHGLDRLFPVTKMVIPLDKPSNTKYTVGTAVSESFTEATNNANSRFHKQLAEMPPPSSILKMAAENATKLITGATTGYVTLHKNGDIIDEIIISDEENYKNAQRIWRWNQNGLGYSDTGYEGTFGTAITMDGSIVADRVTTGTMHADRIHGGTLTLGGYDNVNGVFKLVDGEGNVMITMTHEGIDMKSADRDGYFLNLKDGQLYGGYGSAVWGRVSPTIQTETDDPENPLHGLWIDGACINITPQELLIGNHNNPTEVWSTVSGTVNVVTDVDSSGHETKKKLTFKHGLLISIE